MNAFFGFHLSSDAKTTLLFLSIFSINMMTCTFKINETINYFYWISIFVPFLLFSSDFTVLILLSPYSLISCPLPCICIFVLVKTPCKYFVDVLYILSIHTAACNPFSAVLSRKEMSAVQKESFFISNNTIKTLGKNCKSFAFRKILPSGRSQSTMM